MPACLGASGSVRAKQEDVVGVLRLGRPDLLAVDHPLVAVELGTGLEPGEVGPGVGLAEPLAPRDLAREDLRQELLLLLLAAPLQDRRADEGVAEEVGPQRCAGTGELLVEHDVLHDRQALAAVLLGPRRADPAAVEQLLRPVLLELAALLRRSSRSRRRTSRPGGSPRARPGSPCGIARPRRGTSDPSANLDPRVKESTCCPFLLLSRAACPVRPARGVRRTCRPSPRSCTATPISSMRGDLDGLAALVRARDLGRRHQDRTAAAAPTRFAAGTAA